MPTLAADQDASAARRERGTMSDWPMSCPKCDNEAVRHTLVKCEDGIERMEHKCPCGADLGRTLTRDKMPKPPPYVPKPSEFGPEEHGPAKRPWWKL
jgi:hypothetical protein